MTSGQPTARSVCLRQVEQIFPFDLVAATLNWLTSRHLCPGRRRLIHVVAGPGIGRELRVDGAHSCCIRGREVRVVSYFVLARFAGQGNRTAFSGGDAGPARSTWPANLGQMR